MELSAEAQMAALRQLGEEYQHPALSWFDRMVNGLNRLPRPFLAFGTIGLFVYAMVDPVGFAQRMVGLNAVPEPLWWLLGAIVAFYFGARETHYFRSKGVVSPYYCCRKFSYDPLMRIPRRQVLPELDPRDFTLDD